MYPWDILKLVRKFIKQGLTKQAAETELGKLMSQDDVRWGLSRFGWWSWTASWSEAKLNRKNGRRRRKKRK